jgi:chaperone modulatory protein CbpM
MRISIQDFAGQSNLDMPTLTAWVEAEWLMPLTETSPPLFSEVDLARARLIQQLQADFGVNSEGISIILHLLDQLHGLRSVLREVQILGTHDQNRLPS